MPRFKTSIRNPRIDNILRTLTAFKYFSEMDLDSGYLQFKILKNLSDIFTFTCSKSKVSMGVLPFGVSWAASIFQATMCNLFLELLLRCLKIYINNLLVHSSTQSEHLTHPREVFDVCKEANLHLRMDPISAHLWSLQFIHWVHQLYLKESLNQIQEN